MARWLHAQLVPQLLPIGQQLGEGNDDVVIECRS